MINKKIFILFCILFLSLNSCTSVKDALTGKKSENSDEFLVIKKNPLVMPPDYDDLPEPSDEEDVEDEKDKVDIQKIIGIYSEEEQESSDSTESIEEFVLENINKD